MASDSMIRRLLWFAFIWLISVGALAIVAYVLRLVIG